MISTSLFIELLRTRPRLLFWAMAALQIVPWTLVPVLFYSSPPGQLPLVIAIGHEFQFGTEFGPPLAFWLAEIAYRIGGMFGVYLLSQICIVMTYATVFALGRLIVGAPQAACAVLLMGGIAVFSVPTPEFGPMVLATPLWALSLYHFWVAMQRGSSLLYWVALGVDAGLLFLTTYAGLILIGLLFVYMLATRQGRAQFDHIGPWFAGIAIVAVMFPYLIWLDLSTSIAALDLATILANTRIWVRLLATLLLSHAGMLILIVLAIGPFASRGTAPPIVRAPVGADARRFVYLFAVLPALAMGLFALFTHRPENFLAAPLAVMSGLAIVVAAGDRIKIEHQYLIGYAWATLMLLPVALVAIAVVFQPWILALDLSVDRPARQLGLFFGDSYARRTGGPLKIVAGDQSLASLVALTAPSRPSLYLDSIRDDRARITRKDITEKGAVILWLATDSAGQPPAAIAQQFPGLVVEVPRAFERRYQGRMPLMRVGWGMIRPRAQTQ